MPVMAIWRRGKPDALLQHSDRGSQYTSDQSQWLMADHGAICSIEPIEQRLGHRLLVLEDRAHRAQGVLNHGTKPMPMFSTILNTSTFYRASALNDRIFESYGVRATIRR